DTLNTIVSTINGTAGLSSAVQASIDTSGGTNKLKITSTSADFDFGIDPVSTDALTTTLGLSEVNHASSNLITKGVSPGESLTVTVGANTFTLDFGYGGAQISTLPHLTTPMPAYPAAIAPAPVH